LFSSTNILDNSQSLKSNLPLLFDNHGREMSYLRLAVTDRCNLRCTYCMPAEGIAYLPEKKLLSWEEMLRIVHVLNQLGIRKVRITGGEPFVRPGLMDFLQELAKIENLEICLTTNGVLLENHLDSLLNLGIKNVNLSLDSLDSERFFKITRRNDFDQVYRNLMRMIEANFIVKLNAVVMHGMNEMDILPLVNFTEKHPVSVRFIEEMPFNGSGLVEEKLFWDYRRILSHIKTEFPHIEEVPMAYGETSKNYHVPGFMGDVGIIAAFSRTFCGSCNRIRVTSLGQVKTCLYDDGVFDLKEYLRLGVSDEDLKNTMIKIFGERPKDGFEAENNRKGVINESMTSIGG
jgi:molybdenum cofactor biosynthesis protein A